MQAPLREDVVPREQTAPEAPPPTFESDGVVLPNPQAHAPRAVPYGFVWCASDYIDSCTVEDHVARVAGRREARRYREIVSQVRSWDAELPSREGSRVPELLNRITRARARHSGSWWGRSRSSSGDRAARARFSPSGSRPASSCSCTRSRRASRRSSRCRCTRSSSSRRSSRCRETSARAGHLAVPRAAVDPRARAHRCSARRSAVATLDAQSFWLDELVYVSLLDRASARCSTASGRQRRRRTCTTCSPGRGRTRSGSERWGCGRSPRSSGPSRSRSRTGGRRARLAAGRGRRRRSRRRPPVPRLVRAGGTRVQPPRAPRSVHGALPRPGAARARRADLALWAVASSLAIATHYFAVFLVAAEAAWLVARYRPRRDAAVAPPRPPPSSSARLPLLAAQRGNGETVGDTSLLSGSSARRRRSSSATASPRRSPGASSRSRSSPSG